MVDSPVGVSRRDNVIWGLPGTPRQAERRFDALTTGLCPGGWGRRGRIPGGLRAGDSGGLPLIRAFLVTRGPGWETPGRLAPLVPRWQIAPDVPVLSGSVVEVELALDRLGITRRRDPKAGEVDHIGTDVAPDGRGTVVSRLEGGWGQVDVLLAAVPVPVVTDGLSP